MREGKREKDKKEGRKVKEKGAEDNEKKIVNVKELRKREGEKKKRETESERDRTAVFEVNGRRRDKPFGVEVEAPK